MTSGVRVPERGLVVRRGPVEKILQGTKTWEIRTRSTNVRGRIALIESASGLIVATVELVDVKGPLRYSEYRDNARKWGGKSSDVGRSDHLRYYAWVLKNPTRFRTPIPYRHPRGAIIWVKLTPKVIGKRTKE